LDKNKTKVK